MKRKILFLMLLMAFPPLLVRVSWKAEAVSTSAQQQPSVVSKPQSTTVTPANEDLPVRFSLDHRDNAARLEFQGREPLDVGEGSVTRIYIKTGERWERGAILMIVKALVTYSIAPVRPGGPDTRTTEEDIRVKSIVRGTITKLTVHEGQRIHHDNLLATIHKD